MPQLTIKSDLNKDTFMQSDVRLVLEFMKDGFATLKHSDRLRVGPEGISWAELICTCEVDMREVSCRPVKSDEETLTGAPR